MENKGAILIQRGDRTVKYFKTWHHSTPDKAKVEIKFKDKDGNKKVLVKEYTGTKDTVALCKCVEAVIHYWPKYDPAKYEIIMSSGHVHEVTTKKKSTKKKRKGKGL